MASPPIAIIAGSGQFPLLLARQAREEGRWVVAMAIEGEADPALAAEVDHLAWIGLGKLGRLIKELKKAGAAQAVMCGAIAKTRIFKDIKPDLKALTLSFRLKNLLDDGILRGVAQILAEEGVEIIPAHEFLPSLLAVEGVYGKRGPSSAENRDIDFGWRMAGELGRLDIGQCVVVKRRVVVAVEAVEGTDAAIARAGELSGPGCVVVKRLKPQQDKRFDLPTVGAGTIEAMAKAGASCLVIEAGASLVFDKPAMIAAADQAGICLMARREQNL